MRLSIMKGGKAPKAPAEIPLGTGQRVGTLLPSAFPFTLPLPDFAHVWSITALYDNAARL